MLNRRAASGAATVDLVIAEQAVDRGMFELAAEPREVVIPSP